MVVRRSLQARVNFYGKFALASFFELPETGQILFGITSHQLVYCGLWVKMCILLFTYCFVWYLQAAEKGWEEKRQNIGHYDGQEFERMLQEAEANMLRGIPNLEVPSKPEGSPATPAVLPASLEEVIEKNEPTAAPTEQGKRPKDMLVLLRLLFGDVYAYFFFLQMTIRQTLRNLLRLLQRNLPNLWRSQLSQPWRDLLSPAYPSNPT